MIFRSKEDVRPQCDERNPLVDLEYGCKAWFGQADGGRIGSADSAGRLFARSACLPRELSQSLGFGLDCRHGPRRRIDIEARLPGDDDPMAGSARPDPEVSLP